MKHTTFDLAPLKARSIELAASHCGIVFGRDRKALCPAHDDKTPSLSYWPKGELFKCWSCGWSGDIVALYRLVTGATFIVAAKALGAAPSGVLRQRSQKPADARREAGAVEGSLFRQIACLRDVLDQIADDEERDVTTRLDALISARQCDETLDSMLAMGAAQ
ncbi:MAG TPA: CHC2 zinc finger domain-containing protein [Candidatus Binatia bacterium]|jgi:DNA primase